MSDKCDGTTEDGWVTDVTNENGVLVASRIIIEGHFNASKEGIEDETVVDEVEMEGEHGWVVVDYDLVEEDGEYGCWVAYYDIIEGGHFNASEEGIEGETVVDEVDVEGIEHWVVIDYDLEEEGTEDGWVAYYDIIEGHFNASEEGIEGETVVDEVDVEGIEHWVVIEDGSNVV